LYFSVIKVRQLLVFEVVRLVKAFTSKTSTFISEVNCGRMLVSFLLVQWLNGSVVQ
jgi:hypothetical protein